MTSDELKKLLDDHKVVRSTLNAPCSDCYIQGYEEAVELLWPLVEALINACSCGRKHAGWCAQCKALTDLKEKLKGES